jgi:hypothetical protein
LASGKLQKEGYTKQAADWLSNMTMVTFNATEAFSRHQAAEMGKLIARDALSGNSDAVKYFAEMPGSYSASMTKALDKVKNGVMAPEALEDMMAQFMITRTTLRYGNVDKSELAVYLGRYASQFTRWPQEGIGRINVATNGGSQIPQGSARLAREVFGTTAILLTADAFLDETMGEDSPRRQALFGRDSLLAWSPVADSLVSNVEHLSGAGKDLRFTPPMPTSLATAGTELYKGAFKEDYEMDTEKVALNLMAVTPGLGWMTSWYKLIAKTAPKVLEDREP